MPYSGILPVRNTWSEGHVKFSSGHGTLLVLDFSVRCWGMQETSRGVCVCVCVCVCVRAASESSLSAWVEDGSSALYRSSVVSVKQEVKETVKRVMWGGRGRKSVKEAESHGFRDPCWDPEPAAPCQKLSVGMRRREAGGEREGDRTGQTGDVDRRKEETE